MLCQFNDCNYSSTRILTVIVDWSKMKELDLAVNINIGSEDALVALVSRITNADAVKKELIAGSLAASLINCTHVRL